MLFLFLFFVVARADVQCGNSVCTASTGLFCHGTVCSKSNWTSIIDSGSCTNLLYNKEQCDQAATSLNLSDTSAVLGAWSGESTGCALYNGNLYYNTKQTDVACGTNANCLCWNPPACSDGLNSAVCQCGSSVCMYTGMSCDSSTSLCTAPACSDGLNSAACQCGTSLCSPGLFCHGTVCSKSNWTSIIDSGSCTNLLYNKEQCDQAATSLNLSDTSAVSQAWTIVPTGCIASANQLIFNTHQNGVHCGNGWDCLCWNPPECSYGWNDVQCQCGSSVCTEETGLFCHDTACSKSSKSFPYRTDSGLCQPDNIWLSLNKKGCEQAATSLALSYTSVTSGWWSSYPTGCIARGNGLFFNGYQGEHACGTNGWDCLCLNFTTTTTTSCSISDMSSCTDAQLIQIKTSYSNKCYGN